MIHLCNLDVLMSMSGTNLVSMHSLDKSLESGVVLSLQQLIRYPEVGESKQLVLRRAILVDALRPCIPEDGVVSCCIIPTECIFTRNI